MTTRVLVCDDSTMAQKQLTRALPSDWDITVTFAKDGLDCLAKLRDGLGELLLLDLNMPGLDGYGVLAAINQEDLQTLTIVISADVQPEARARVRQLGAIDFIRKPVEPEMLARLLQDYGLYQLPESTPNRRAGSAEHGLRATMDPAPTDWQDALQELANVAMGRAGDLLARLLHLFIRLPVPRVNTLAPSELTMALSVASETGSWSGVCQGFVGAGISGEALLLFSDSRFEEVARLLGYEDPSDPSLETEVLMDLSSILVGAFLNGLGEQLDIRFGINHPSVLGQHLVVDHLLEQNRSRWNEMLSIELNYTLEDYDIRCDLLLLFAEDAIPMLRKLVRSTGLTDER